MLHVEWMFIICLEPQTPGYWSFTGVTEPRAIGVPNIFRKVTHGSSQKENGLQESETHREQGENSNQTEGVWRKEEETE